ncbi:MAG: hypothetical protein V4722_27560 [Bacteroidota bacterium]
MKQLTNIFVSFFAVMLTANTVAAQPPAGKYNTENFPEDRKAIDSLNGPASFLNDDVIAVGPEGKISYGFAQWLTPVPGLEDMGFKSITPVPGMAVFRIYNGDAAVRHYVVDVVLTSTTKGDFAVRVIRTETFIKTNGKWHMVYGQGTKWLNEKEFKLFMEQSLEAAKNK